MAKFDKHFKTVDGKEYITAYNEQGTGAWIPPDPGNRDYIKMMKEVDAKTSEIVDVDDTNWPPPSWTDIRAKRDELLKETDYLNFSDTGTMTDGIKAYRQALRDVPQDNDKPENVTWPTKP